MKKHFLVLATALLASACSILPPPAAQPQLHDFGQLPAATAGGAGQARVDRVVAPVWIDDGAIHYRLSYSDPTVLRSYADHRWVAQPSDMLRLRLQYLLQDTSNDAQRPGFTVGLELIEFEQDFSSAKQAEVRLVAQVTLRSATDGKVLGQKQFQLSDQSTPDVSGAVAGLSKLAEQAAEQISGWCDQTAQPKG